MELKTFQIIGGERAESVWLRKPENKAKDVATGTRLPARAVGILQDSSVTPHCLLHWFILSYKENEDETCWARVSFQTLLNSLLSSDIARRSSKRNALYFCLLLWPVCHPFFFSDKHVRKMSVYRILEPLAFALQRLFHQKVVDVAALQGNEVANSNGDRP